MKILFQVLILAGEAGIRTVIGYEGATLVIAPLGFPSLLAGWCVMVAFAWLARALSVAPVFWIGIELLVALITIVMAWNQPNAWELGVALLGVQALEITLGHYRTEIAEAASNNLRPLL